MGGKGRETKMFYQDKILDFFLVTDVSPVQQYCSSYLKDAQVIFINIYEKKFMDKSIILLNFCCFMRSFDSIYSWLVSLLFYFSQAVF